MYTLNEKIRDLEPYEPIAGEYKIRLDANESFLCLPESVMASALHAMMRVELNRYPDPTAKDLCAAFAKSYKVKPACVAAGNGSDELINVIFQSFLMKGETYATLTPDFSMYDFYGYVSECRGIEIKKDENFTIDIDKVIETCNNENVKLLIFSNPCNPTSVGLTRETVRKIIRGVSALVVLDEAYMDFWNESMLGEFENYDNLLILKTCSKAFGLAALRVGFAVGNEKLVRAIKAVKSPYNVNTCSQKMAEAVLKNRAEDARKPGRKTPRESRCRHPQIAAFARRIAAEIRPHGAALPGKAPNGKERYELRRSAHTVRKGALRAPFGRIHRGAVL